MSSDPLSPTDIAPEYAGRVSTQEYSRAAAIEGVKLIDLRLLHDDGGTFAELARTDEYGALIGLPGFVPRQTSYSLVLPGAIKAYHLHYKQDDVWFVPPTDRLLVGLVDVRKNSPTKGTVSRIVLGSGRAQLLFVPRGVAHGVANLWNVPGTIFYFVSEQFNLADPDERRLPYDLVGHEIWQITPG